MTADNLTRCAPAAQEPMSLVRSEPCEHPGEGLPAWLHTRAQASGPELVIRLGHDALADLKSLSPEELGLLVLLATHLSLDGLMSWANAVDAAADHGTDQADRVRRKRLRELLRQAARRNSEVAA